MSSPNENSESDGFACPVNNSYGLFSCSLIFGSRIFEYNSAFAASPTSIFDYPSYEESLHTLIDGAVGTLNCAVLLRCVRSREGSLQTFLSVNLAEPSVHEFLPLVTVDQADLFLTKVLDP